MLPSYTTPTNRDCLVVQCLCALVTRTCKVFGSDLVLVNKCFFLYATTVHTDVGCCPWVLSFSSLYTDLLVPAPPYPRSGKEHGFRTITSAVVYQTNQSSSHSYASTWSIHVLRNIFPYFFVLLGLNVYVLLWGFTNLAKHPNVLRRTEGTWQLPRSLAHTHAHTCMQLSG